MLSFLYPNLRFNNVKFHQDHIHPISHFSKSKLKELGLSDDDQRFYSDFKDTLPNLQIMEGIENIKKNDTLFETWIDLKDENGNPIISDKEKFLTDNYIAKDHTTRQV